MDLIKNSGVLCYYFKDSSVFINTKRIFLEIEYEACLEDDTALTQNHNVSACNVMSHSIIDSCVLNIGECQLNRNQGFYPLIAKVNYITRYSEKARSSFLADFEGETKDRKHLHPKIQPIKIIKTQLWLFLGAKDDIREELTTDVSKCFKQTRDEAGNAVFTPTNSQGEIALSLQNKKTHNYLIQLHSPLQSIGSLIPNNVDIGNNLAKEKMKLDITHCCQIKARQWDAFSLTAIVSLFPCLCLFLSLSLSLPPLTPQASKSNSLSPPNFSSHKRLGSNQNTSSKIQRCSFWLVC